MRKALTSAPVYTPLKFLYNSEPRTTPNTASLPETSCLSGRCSCHVCGLGAGTGVYKSAQERILTRGSHSRVWTGNGTKILPLPTVLQTSPGSPPSQTCTCCSFHPEGPSSHSPSVNPYRPSQTASATAEPVSPAPPLPPACPELPPSQHH